MKNSFFKRIVSSIIAASLLFSSAAAAFGATDEPESADIKGHWAEAQIADWVNQGLVQGYANGSFKPDNPITRAEFIALINRSFEFSETATIAFSDVDANNWAYAEVAKAVKAGYIKGYSNGTIGATQSISRQETAVIISRLLQPASATEPASATFLDQDRIAAWSSDAVASVVGARIMNGYTNNSFKPEVPITRAEAVVTLSRALKVHAAAASTVSYNAAGVYGPATGVETVNKNVEVNAPGVTLQNLVINGDLLLGEGIGDGDAFLENVKVTGTVTVQGGGENSIHFNNSVLVDIIIDKKTGLGTVRIISEGTTTVALVIVNSPATVQETGATGSGFGNVTLSSSLPAGSKVSLQGSFETVNVSAQMIQVDVPEGTIKNLNANPTATGMSLNLSQGATINSIVLDAIIKVLGQGTIVAAVMNTTGTTFEKPANTTTTPNPSPTPTPTPSPSPSSTPPADTTAPAASVVTALINGTANVTTAQSTEAGTLYLVLQSATFTTVTAAEAAVTGGTASKTTGVAANTPVTISTAALADGVYKVIAADAAGNVSAPSSGTITLDSTSPAATVTTASMQSGTVITTAQSTEAGALYLVSASANISTEAAANDAVTAGTAAMAANVLANTPANLATTVLASGTYKVVAVDAAGNLSAPSAGTITLDNAAPEATVTTALMNNAANVTTAQSTEAGTLYLVPQGAGIVTVTAAEAAVTGETASKTTGVAANTPVTISTADLADGEYKVIAVDEAGNVSEPSVGTITLDSTAPEATVTAASMQSGTDVTTAQTTEAGALYLVSAVANITTAAEANDAVTAGTAVMAANALADTPADLATTGLASGTYKVFAVDAAGNLSAPSEGTITLDNEAPVSTVDDANINSGTDVTNAYSTEAGKLYLVLSTADITTEAAAEAAVTAGTAAASQVAANTAASISPAGLAEGEYKVIAVDAAGNVSSPSSGTVRLDNTAPALSVTGTATAPVLNFSEPIYAYPYNQSYFDKISDAAYTSYFSAYGFFYVGEGSLTQVNLSNGTESAQWSFNVDSPSDGDQIIYRGLPTTVGAIYDYARNRLFHSKPNESDIALTYDSETLTWSVSLQDLTGPLATASGPLDSLTISFAEKLYYKNEAGELTEFPSVTLDADGVAESELFFFHTYIPDGLKVDSFVSENDETPTWTLSLTGFAQDYNDLRYFNRVLYDEYGNKLQEFTWGSTMLQIMHSTSWGIGLFYEDYPVENSLALAEAAANALKVDGSDSDESIDEAQKLYDRAFGILQGTYGERQGTFASRLNNVLNRIQIARNPL